MRILYLIHQFYPEFQSGTEKFLLNLSSAIQRDGHFIEVVTYALSKRPREGFQRDHNLFIRGYNYGGLPVTVIRHQTLPMDINTSCVDPAVYKFALRYLQVGKRYDLIHFAHPMRVCSFANAARDLGVPYLLTLTDFWMICPKITLQTKAGTLCAGAEGGRACESLCAELDPVSLKFRLSVCRDILTRARAVVSPSYFLAAVFKREFPNLTIRIIPHGMDSRYLKQNVRSYRQGDHLVLGYCGGLSPHKGVHLLLKAFRDLNPENAELKIYGSCFYEGEYVRMLQQISGQDKRITFCGVYSEKDVGSVLSGIDLLILPSLWYENYPLILHEALACAVPLVVSNIGGMAEKIKDSVNGFTFQVGDEQDLKDKLRQILDNPQNLNGIKENMRQYAVPLVEEEAYLYGRLYKSMLP